MLPGDLQHLQSMQNVVGMLTYLGSWRWFKEPGIVEAAGGFLFGSDALPLVVDDGGEITGVGSAYLAGELVFASGNKAFS